MIFKVKQKNPSSNNQNQLTIDTMRNLQVIRIINYMWVHITFLVVSLGLAWSRLYYPNSPSLVNRVSYLVGDKPWMPPGFEATPILGSHYFGDLQLPIAWARYSNPWETDLIHRANFLPFGKYLLLPFSYLPIKLVFCLYVIGSIAILYVAVRKIIKLSDKTNLYKNWKITFILFCILFVMSRPVLTDLDRGNFYTVSISLWVLAFVWLREDKHKKFLFAMTLLVAIKWFLIIPMIPFILEKKLNLSVKLLVWISTVNFVSLVTVPGGLINNLRSIIDTQKNYTDEWAIPYLMDGTSVASSVSKIHEYFFGTTQTVAFITENINLLRFFCIVYLALALYISSRLNLPMWVRLYFALSTITFDTFETMWYAQMWISFVLLAWFYEERKNLNDYRLVSLSLQFSALTMLIPLWVAFSINGVMRFNFNLILTPMFALLSGTVLVASKYFRKKSKHKI